jgi:hypothetical protein
MWTDYIRSIVVGKYRSNWSCNLPVPFLLVWFKCIVTDHCINKFIHAYADTMTSVPQPTRSDLDDPQACLSSSFFCGLLSSALNVLTIQRWLVGCLVTTNWMGFRRKGSRPNRKTISASSWKNWGKKRKTWESVDHMFRPWSESSTSRLKRQDLPLGHPARCLSYEITCSISSVLCRPVRTFKIVRTKLEPYIWCGKYSVILRL